MEAKKTKIKNTEKLTVRDYITIAILLVLHFIVYSFTMPIGMTAVGSLFTYALSGLFLGIIYILMCTKVNKKYAPLIFGCGIALIQMMNFWVVGIVMGIGGILAEIIWENLDRRKFSTIMLCYIIQVTFLYLGMVLPLIFLKDMYIQSLSAYEELYAGAYEVACSYLFFVALFATIGSSVIGSFLGKKVLKKHFEKAGIVA